MAIFYFFMAPFPSSIPAFLLRCAPQKELHSGRVADWCFPKNIGIKRHFFWFYRNPDYQSLKKFIGKKFANRK
ncbi:hypothetical protein EGI11_04985 [Chryseobacterium sp. H3056]|uniref:Uncharacterized protein n=1 Tax=Kaistella daneshvariae TaxID=2487074 RepID=A0A3N0WUQ1_9FLAO|nr:hypothetical protein EGI11_04985 [Kaistella daneshvariae]